MLRTSSSQISLKRAGHKGPRHTPTNIHRQTLRRWWNDDSNGIRKHEDAIAWWLQEYGWKLSTSTVSDYLSQKYTFLDEKELNQHTMTVRKNRACNWEELEVALIEWQIRYDLHHDSGSTTGDLLCIKASQFWMKLPCYQSITCSK